MFRLVLVFGQGRPGGECSQWFKRSSEAKLATRLQCDLQSGGNEQTLPLPPRRIRGYQLRVRHFAKSDIDRYTERRCPNAPCAASEGLKLGLPRATMVGLREASIS